MKVMTARYAGSCDGCGGCIKPGDKIAWDRREGTYHESCKPSADPAADREYWAGRADAERYISDKRIYGEELAEQWEIEREMRGLDDY